MNASLNMACQAESPQLAVLRMLTSIWISKAMHAVVELGIPDQIGTTGKRFVELAHATHSNPDTLYRLLRGLSAAGIFSEGANGEFRNTDLGLTLRRNAPDSMCGPARLIGMPMVWKAWGELLYSVRSGRCAFEHVAGDNLDDYFKAHPAEAKILNAATTDMEDLEAPSVVRAYDFSSVRFVVDIAGHHGRLLAEVLKANPRARGALIEMPRAAEGARRLFADHGVQSRAEVITADAFEAELPSADLYIMKKVIKDWEDNRALQLMRNCARAMTKSAKLLLAERVVAAQNVSDYAKIWDLNLLVVGGGRERTADQYRSLYTAAGLSLTHIYRTEGTLNVMEGGAAPSGL